MSNATNKHPAFDHAICILRAIAELNRDLGLAPMAGAESPTTFRVALQDRRIEVTVRSDAFGEGPKHEVNWSAIGSVSPASAAKFAKGIEYAIALSTPLFACYETAGEHLKDACQLIESAVRVAAERVGVESYNDLHKLTEGDVRAEIAAAYTAA
jgi:hypothetical protein